MQNVKFKHIRFYNLFEHSCGFGLVKSNLGGMTLAFKREDETVENGDFLLGVSVCSGEDNYCYKTGRDIATKRLEANPLKISSATLDQLIVDDVDDILCEDGDLIEEHFKLRIYV
jgi:hypothetical protein